MLITVVIPVYRDGVRARSAAEAILKQDLPSGSSVEVILVNDGSGDDTSSQLAELDDPRIRIVEMPVNVGRSAARNAGARIAGGDFIVFLDCDCLPKNDSFIRGHYDHLSTGAVASTGNVLGADDDFWSRYQRNSSIRRRQQHSLGFEFSGSSQNLAVSSEAFNATGGFDSRYKKYGFEDRDLLIRLASMGRVAWAEKAEVVHLDPLSMRGVSRKMLEAGGSSSLLFSADHPAAYKALGYAQLDARFHPRTAWLAPLATALLPLLSSLVELVIRIPVPFVIKAGLVTGVSGISYWIGTVEASQHSERPLARN
jgi:GT2 family glycosyltransferase